MTEPVWNLVLFGKIAGSYPTRLECAEVLDWLGLLGECVRAIAT